MNLLLYSSLEQDTEFCQLFLDSLPEKSNIDTVTNYKSFESAVNNKKYEAILLELKSPETDGPAFVLIAKRAQPTTPIIVIAERLTNEEPIVNLVKIGAKDFVVKTNLKRLTIAVEKAIEEARIEKEIREENEYIRQKFEEYSLIFENSPMGICLVSAEGKVLDANPAMCQMLGYSRDELLYKHFLDFTYPDDVEKSNEFVRQIISGERDGGVLEKRYRHKAGHIIWALLTTKLIRDDNGEPKYFVTQIKDISERVAREIKLQIQAEIINAVDAAIIVTNDCCEIKFWSKGAEKNLGWTADEVAEQKIMELGIFNSETCAKINSILKEQGSYKDELNIVTKSNQSKIFASLFTHTRSFFDENGRVVIVLIDITEKKNAEQKLMHAQRVETIGMLAGGIAHDLNNSLTPIKMGIEMLQQKQLDEDDSRLLAAMEKSVNRSISILGQILAFGRETAQVKTAINLNYLISEIKNVINVTFPDNINLQVIKGQNLWDVVANKTQLYQVLLNLCVNARDAMPQGGVLTIKTANVKLSQESLNIIPGAKPGNYVLVSVSDTGSGISQEILDKIFDPFFTTKESGKGTGLGLYIVKNVVKECGGFINVSSSQGEGTTFEIYLPAETKITSQQEKTDELRSLPRGNGETILLVDDNESLRVVTRTMLESYGYKVVEAVDGADAIAKFIDNRDKIRLIIMDMSMPIMDGPSAIKVIRKLDKHISIIAASAISSPSLKLNVEEDKIFAVMQKPFVLKELLVAISTALKSES